MAYNYAYAKQWRLDRNRGLKRTTSAKQARRHIAILREHHWSLRAIAAAAGVSVSAVARIAKGEQDTVNTRTAAKILAVDLSAVPHKPSTQTAEPFVPRIGTVRRIQALLFMGWGHQQMRAHCGLSTARLLHQQGRWVTRSTHDAIASMFAELAMRPGPSSKAQTYARQRGYASPLAWDDIDLDDAPAGLLQKSVTKAPSAYDEAAVLRALQGDRHVQLTKADREEITRRWIAAGRPLVDLERFTGLNAHRYINGEVA